jgi:hypothetical protein
VIPFIHKILMKIGVTTDRTDTQNQSARADRNSTITQTTNNDNSVTTTNNYHNPPQPTQAPSIFMSIYGDASQDVFRGQVENRSSVSLVAEHIKIGDEVTELGQQGRGQMFNRLFLLPSLNFDRALFAAATESVPVVLRYRTTDADPNTRHFDYILNGVQRSRVAGGFDVVFPDSPQVRAVEV